MQTDRERKNVEPMKRAAASATWKQPCQNPLTVTMSELLWYAAVYADNAGLYGPGFAKIRQSGSQVMLQIR